jgi:hypothetical protein
LKHYKASSIATRSSIESVSTVETFGFFFGGAERGGAERGGAENSAVPPYEAFAGDRGGSLAYRAALVS